MHKWATRPNLIFRFNWAVLHDRKIVLLVEVWVMQLNPGSAETTVCAERKINNNNKCLFALIKPEIQGFLWSFSWSSIMPRSAHTKRMRYSFCFFRFFYAFVKYKLHLTAHEQNSPECSLCFMSLTIQCLQMQSSWGYLNEALLQYHTNWGKLEVINIHYRKTLC